jgi:lipoprotein-anchoring transpeptidase ErfK/SrfK
LAAGGLVAWHLKGDGRTAVRPRVSFPVSSSNVWSLQDIVVQKAPMQLSSGKGSEPISAPDLPPGVTEVVELPFNEPGYNEPDGREVKSVPGQWWGYRSELPVAAVAPGGWLQVRLAQRPNQSTAWIQDTGLKMFTTPYEIVVNLRTRRVELYKDAKRLYDFPAGVGSATDPTPTGHYFIAFYAPPPPGEEDLYGPWQMFTSDHSDSILDWEGSGDAMIAIHGPIGADSEIGTDGSYISHGCIRLLISDQVKLHVAPVGTPIVVIA